LDPEEAVNWLTVRYDYLVATTGRSVMLKEAGFPSAGADGGNQETQLAFFQALDSTELPFFYFEAFDQPWKTDVLGQLPVEAHWGLYHTDGTPKKVIAWLAKRWSE
jgi:exo-beta-1,3-glucanase (GH17 family)